MTATMTRPPVPRLESLAWVVFAHLVALAAALWVIPLLGCWRPLCIVIAADVEATFVAFFFSLRWNNGSVYDPYWSVVPSPWLLGAHAAGQRRRPLAVT